MKNEYSWEGGHEDPNYEGKLKDKDWDRLNPDSAIHSWGDSNKFTAFIWVYDKKSGKSLLYSQPGNEYHGSGTSAYGGNEFKADQHH